MFLFDHENEKKNGSMQGRVGNSGVGKGNLVIALG